jgi:lysophospholipase L1-like esterase
LGFRGKVGSDVAVLGDSFTYGWGVEDNETFCSILGLSNFGRPGANPVTYADAAEDLYAFKPSRIIVVITQGDDLSQLVGREFPRNYMRSFLKWLSPNLILFVKHRKPPVIETRKIIERWQISDPQHFIKSWDISTPKVINAIRELSRQLKRIKRVAPTIVVVAPYGIYTNREDFEAKRELGARLVEDMLTKDPMDRPIRAACVLAGVDFYTFTKEFRENKNRLFFKSDGHLNQAGHRFFAECLEDILKNNGIRKN